MSREENVLNMQITIADCMKQEWEAGAYEIDSR